MRDAVVLEIAGDLRAVSRKWWVQLQGPLPPEGYSCDGCSWSPDWFHGWKLWPACAIHDFHYRTEALGSDALARARADVALRANLQTLLRIQGAPAWRRNAIAWAFWSRVRIYGARSFDQGTGAPDERNFFRRVWETYGPGRR